MSGIVLIIPIVEMIVLPNIKKLHSPVSANATAKAINPKTDSQAQKAKIKLLYFFIAIYKMLSMTIL